MIKHRARLAGILTTTAALVVGGGSSALAERDHPEDGPHHAGSGQASAVLRHIDGTVLSKNSDARTFRLRTEGGRTLRIRVNSTTRFERISGFAGLRRGLRVEVNAKRTDSGLLARSIETRGGGGNGGGGADDPPGDDHGSGGHGADDGPNHS